MGRIDFFAVSKRHKYQRIDVALVEMMSVACHTPSSDVVKERYRNHKQNR